jgi:hypothetical protein
MLVSACIDTIATKASVFTEDADTELGFAFASDFVLFPAVPIKRQDVVLVLDEHGAFSSDLAGEYVVVCLCLDEFVDYARRLV